MKMKTRFVTAVLITFCSLSTGAQASTIDSLNSASGWFWENDSAVALTWAALDTGYSGNGARLTYDMGATGTWAQIGKNFGTIDISEGDELRFSFKGSGNSNKLQVQIVDADGSVFVKTIDGITNRADWTELSMTFGSANSDLAYANWGGNALLDSSKIAKISFGATYLTGGTGTLSIDNVRLYRSTSTLKLFDDFDDLNATNRFGGISGAFAGIPTAVSSGTCVASFVTTTTFSGTGALELRYDVSGTDEAGGGMYAGYWTQLNGVSLAGTTHLSFMVKGTEGGERFKIELGNNTNDVRVQAYTTVTDAWQEVRIPLADFSGLAPASPGNLVFVFENSVNSVLNRPTSSTLYIDDVKFLTPGGENELIATLDTMDDIPNTIGKWAAYGQTSGALAAIAGKSGADTDRALQISYNFSSASDWAVMERDTHLNVADGTAFRFHYKGTGASNNLELKVMDKNGVTFRKTLYGVTSTNGEWKTAQIPYKEMTYFSGNGAQVLDLSKLETIWIAVAKGEGGAGSVWLDELEYYATPGYTYSGGRMISTFALQNNPVSPNGDGLNDKARFVYRLSDSALIKLEIFSLKGEKLHASEKRVTADANEHIIEWDALDDDGKRVDNGLYLYRVTAEGYDGQKDTVTNVLGVIR